MNSQINSKAPEIHPMGTASRRRRLGFMLLGIVLLGVVILRPNRLFAEPAVAEPKEDAAESAVKKLEAKLEASKEGKETKKTIELKKWIRLQRNANGDPVAMQTPIVRYAPIEGSKQKKDLIVELIGAVHVGDDAYYANLNKRFQKYDALLYELVAPEGTVVEKGRGTSNAHPIGAMQNGMKNMFQLEHQLEKIDYTKKNFVHADMSPEELSKSMKDRGESFMQMYFRLMGAGIAQQGKMQAKGKGSDLDMIRAFFSKDRDRQLKIALAEQFENVDGIMKAFNGAEGSSLLTERNRVAFEVLEKEIKNGKKHLAVFYGAAHLADMDQRLRKEFQMEPVEVQWVDAWNLRE